MAIVVMQEVPGADAAFADGMRQAGVVEELQAAKGFRGHWSGATGSAYRVIELWDSREEYQAWYDGHIAPKLPPGAEVTEPQFFDLHFEITPQA